MQPPLHESMTVPGDAATRARRSMTNVNWPTALSNTQKRCSALSVRRSPAADQDVPSRPLPRRNQSLMRYWYADGLGLSAEPMVASFGFPLAFWQPSLPCSRDNPLELLAEHWVVGMSPNPSWVNCCTVYPGLSFRSSATAAAASAFCPRQAYAEARSSRRPERLPGRHRLEAPVDGLSVPRQVRVRVAEDKIPEYNSGSRGLRRIACSTGANASAARPMAIKFRARPTYTAVWL